MCASVRPKPIRIARARARAQLFAAAQNNHLETLKVLVEFGADVNAVRANWKRSTPLGIAAFAGNVEVVRVRGVGRRGRWLAR